MLEAVMIFLMSKQNQALAGMINWPVSWWGNPGGVLLLNWCFDVLIIFSFM